MQIPKNHSLLTLPLIVTSILFTSLNFFYPFSALASSPTFSSVTCPSTINLADDIASEVDSRISGLVGTTSTKTIFSSQDFTNQIYVRNPDVWTSKGTPIDLTGLSPWNSTGGQFEAGTLITPRHLILASHFAYPVGTVVAFVANDNSVITRTVTAAANATGTDITIEMLDSDVPSTITYYPIIAEDVINSYWDHFLHLPLLVLDAEEKALIHNIFNFGTVTGGYSLFHNIPSDSTEQSFFETLIGGDSGNPGFIIINGKPIIMFSHYSASTGPYYGHYLSAINSILDALGGGYEAASYDLSCFHPKPTLPTFSFSMYDRVATSTVVGTVVASSTNARYNYAIVSGNSSNTFSINTSSGALSVARPGDINASSTPSYTLNVTATDASSSALTASTTVTILVSPTPSFAFSLASNSVSVDETAGTLSLPVTLPNATSSSVSVDYSTIDGSALRGTHFSLTPGTLTFPTGQTTATITISIIDRPNADDNTSFLLSLSNPIGGFLGTTSSETITITNVSRPPPPPPSFSAGGGGGGGNYYSSYYTNNPTPSLPTTSIATTPASTPSTPSTPSIVNKIITLGTTDESVKILQQELNKLGYTVAVSGAGSVGNETNYFGTRSEQALMKFQKDRQLLVTGTLTTETEQALTAVLTTKQTAVPSILSKNLSLGLDGPEVRILQIFLNSYGYFIAESGPGSQGNETTYFGTLTKIALERFQAAHDIETTGTVGPKTRTAISQILPKN